MGASPILNRVNIYINKMINNIFAIAFMKFLFDYYE